MIFRYTILYVENVQATMAFYERAFGFERGFLHEAGDYGELLTGQTKLAFSSRSLMHSLGKDVRPPDAEHPTFELAFETADVKGALGLGSFGAVIISVSAPTRCFARC